MPSRLPSDPVPSTRPRASSQPPPAGKSVHFNSISPTPSSPNTPPKVRKRHYRSGADDESYDFGDGSSSATDHPSRRHDRHHRRRAFQDDIPRSPSPARSDTTIDLPERFDKYGRRKPERGEDPLADTVEEFLSGKGAAGKLFSRLTGIGVEDENDGSGRRRRRG